MKLYCTFIPYDTDPNKTISEINKSCGFKQNRVFLIDVPKLENYLITYNPEFPFDNEVNLPNTIQIHRKKTGTLYTINALNEIIKQENDGVLDINYPINWDNYRNKLLLYRDNKLKVYKTYLESIIDVSTIVYTNFL